MKFHTLLPPITPCLLSLGWCLYFLEGSIAAQNEVKPLASGLKPPVVLYMAKPSYTEEARKAKIEGVVLLQLVVRKDGTPDSFKVIKGLGYGLAVAASRVDHPPALWSPFSTAHFPKGMPPPRLSVRLTSRRLYKIFRDGGLW